MTKKIVFRLKLRQLAHQVMENRDPEGASRHILTNLHGERPKKIVAAFNNVVTNILKHDKYKDPQGISQVRDLLNFPNITANDSLRIQDILKSPLRTIRWAQHHRQGVFETPHLFEAFSQIQVVQEPFYEFKCPQDIVLRASMDRQALVEENHQHKTHQIEMYHFTEEEIDDMITISQEWCNADMPWTKRRNSLKLLDALALLTGRRKWELCSTLKMRSVPESPYQCEVRGIGKKLFDMEWRRIPLLAPIDVVAAGICKLRKFPHVMGSYAYGQEKLFPKMSHTSTRDIYTRRAFRDRHLNGFHTESCSEMWWRSLALCNSLQTLSRHYTTVVVDGESGKQQKVEPQSQRERLFIDSLMACPLRGPSLNLQQDSV